MRTTSWFIRRLSVISATCLLLASFSACGTNNSASPAVRLQIVDAGGFVDQFAKGMIQSYADSHKDKVSSVEFLPRIAAPDLPGKIKSQQDANHVVTSLIISGYDGVASSVQQGLVEQLTPAHNDQFPGLNDNYLPAAKQYNDLAQGSALVFSYTPSGPIFAYDPAKVPTPPKTIAELKAWIIANPHKFIYAVPRNSGPGRTMLMGLPYLLGDSNPQDPTNGWSKTWQFLKDIKPSLDTNPAKTGETIKDLANGTDNIIATTFGWDVNQKALKQIPATDKTFMLQDTTFVADAAFMMMPKGLDKNTQSVVLDLMHWMLLPAQQALTYDTGYFYPGPCVKNVPITLAPQSSQQVVSQYADPSFDGLIANTKAMLPLDATNLVTAFKMWDTTIGGSS